MQVFTINELTKKVKFLLESNRTLQNLWVSGEISNFKHHSSGHMYFSLKDDHSSIRAVMFRSRSASVFFRPENGMKVLVRGYISLFERDGQYQLYVEELQPDGVGALHIAYEQLKEKLRREGLFQDEYKKPLPLFPKKIGIITSPTGAAIRDMVTVINRRFSKVHIILAPVAVQGDGAPQEIAEGLYLLNQISDLDLIIVGRGGGSIEELWAFNSELVARGIFASKVPVISAVGHEVDFTIADFVADVRAATPSAAAELAVPDVSSLKWQLNNYDERLEFGVKRYLREAHSRLENCLNRRILKNPKAITEQLWQQLDYMKKFLNQSMKNVKSEKGKDLGMVITKLNALNPLTTLERGYSICQKDGDVVKNVEQVEIDDQIEVILNTGKLICKINEKMG